MDHTTRNETIRALAAASAAEIRSRSDRALRAHALRPISGEIRTDVGLAYQSPGAWHKARPARPCVPPICTERPIPLEHTPNHYTGEHRDEVAR